MINNNFTTEETAEILELSVYAIRLWLRKGKITGTKISGTWYIPNDEIKRIKKERELIMSKPSLFRKIFKWIFGER